MTATKKIKYFLSGMGSILDLSGTYFQSAPIEFNLDEVTGSLYEDWVRIGDDMKKAMSKHPSKKKVHIYKAHGS